MAGFGLFHGIHGERADGIGHALMHDGGTCGRRPLP
jgi:hypothetical protein